MGHHMAENPTRCDPMDQHLAEAHHLEGKLAAVLVVQDLPQAGPMSSKALCLPNVLSLSSGMGHDHHGIQKAARFLPRGAPVRRLLWQAAHDFRAYTVPQVGNTICASGPYQ